MTCPTCGATLTSADRICPTCDPWAVPSPQDAAPAAAIAEQERLPSWLKQVIAKPAPAESIDPALRRGPQVLRVALVYNLALSAVFCYLTATVYSGNFESLVGWRFLACAPLLLNIGTAFVRKSRRQTAWLIAVINHVHFNRPELGLLWIARIRELRVARTLTLISIFLYFVLIGASFKTDPGTVGTVRALFLLDGVGLALLTVLGWAGAMLVTTKVRSKIVARLA